MTKFIDTLASRWRVAGGRAALAAVAALAAAMLPAAPANADSGGFPLDHFPAEKLTDLPALQNGARLFVNYCLNCHSAQLMRYSRLTEIGLTEDQIKKNLLFTGDKVGEPMRVAMNPLQAKQWFGAAPPDLSVVARARGSEAGSGADWLYTYLRAYYRDSTRPTGWNNAVYPNVGMPHVLWTLQGNQRGATIDDTRIIKDEKTQHPVATERSVVTFDDHGRRSETIEKTDLKGHGEPHATRHTTLGKASGGSLDAAGYDSEVADLVAYLTYMSDPSAKTRTRLGVWVLVFLAAFCVIAWALNKAYWKDIK